MPPKHKFTKEEVIAAALNIVRRDGLGSVTARNLGAELGSSSHPTFSLFKNMEEVHQEIAQTARELYNGYVNKGLSEEIAFKGVGMQYIHFAINEPKLFELLFLTTNGTVYSLDEILPAIDDNSDKILASIQKAYGLTQEMSYRIYKSMWIFTHGIACICATGMGKMTEEEISALLTEAFTGQIMKMKSEA